MSLNCPLPPSNFDQIVIGHGGGGKLTQDLLRQVIANELGSTLELHDLDAGLFNISKTQTPSELVFTTDSFVVDPIFFPGGDIGKLSVVGTVNDLAMMGAKPIAFSMSFILEEGFSIHDFRKILKSIYSELSQLKISITCGDTKVVPKGKGDKIYINTSAVGEKMGSYFLHPKNICEGDAIIITRDIGAHGAAILCQRSQLGLSTPIMSDCHELSSAIRLILDAQIPLRCARDLTRGGLLSGSVELANTSQKIFVLEETKIPIHAQAQSVCELLGLDPYMIANEGSAILFVSPEYTEATLQILKKLPHCQNASHVGFVQKNPTEGGKGKCLFKMASGVVRRWSLPHGELLPRIC